MDRQIKSLQHISLGKRSQSGMMSLLLVALLTTIIALGSFAVDVAHGAMVREQLQNATDSGALAAAQELGKTNITSADLSRANVYAYSVTAQNYAENVSVSNDSPETTVTVAITNTANERSVTVTAVRRVSTIFAKIFGRHAVSVAARSKASATQYVTSIRPNQVMALAVSIDTVPSNGPMEGKALNSIIGPGAENQEFSIVLSPTNSENGGWVKDWSATDSPELAIGDSVSLQNGNKASDVNALQPGSTIIIPLITGDGPYNKSRQIVGIVCMRVTSVNAPKEIKGRLKEQYIVSGTRGKPNDGLAGQNRLFADQWAPWQVSLTE